jgi:hypothetical protein
MLESSPLPGLARQPRPVTERAGPAALLALLLALGLTWPLVTDLGGRLAGHPGNDSWNHAWGYWWVAHELGEGRLPTWTGLLAWPDGGSLWFIDVAQAALSLPVQWLFGPAAAMNSVVIFDLWLSGFAAWLLARRVTGDGATAVVALILFEAAPHHLAQAYNGITETLATGVLPLALWLLLRVLDRPSPLRGALLGLAMAFAVWMGFYLGLFAILAVGLVLAHALIWERGSFDLRPVFMALAVGAAVATVAAAPALVGFAASLNASDALVARDPAFVAQSLLLHNVTDVVAFFRPGRTASPDLLAEYGEQLRIVIALGWVGLTLALAGLWMTGRRGLRPWWMLGALFFVLALGPRLYALGAPVQVGGEDLPLPFALLYQALPLFDRISHPFRFVTGVHLAVAVLAAAGLRHLIRRRSAPQRLAIALGVGLLVLVEVGLATPAELPVPTSSARIPLLVAALADDPVPGAVLDLPMTVPNLERGVYTWFQTAHGRPVPWGLNEPMPLSLMQNRLTATLIRIEAGRNQTLPGLMPDLELVLGARLLARQGYRYVVLHEALVPPTKRRQLIAVLDAVLEPDRQDQAAGVRTWIVAVAEPVAAAGVGTAP